LLRWRSATEQGILRCVSGLERERTMTMSRLKSGQGRCVRTVDEASDLRLADLPDRREMDALLMCEPTYFEVRDEKNPFMAGNVGSVNRKEAYRQWQALKRRFEELNFPIDVLPGEPELEDMVFAANQVLVGEDADGQRYVVPARMRHRSRQNEVPYYRRWFAAHGYRILELPEDEGGPVYFEGHGDAIWHPGKRLIWGGWGQRSELRAHVLLAELLDLPVIALNLPNPKFYHLDTAFCPLDVESAAVFPGAFDQAGMALIRRYFGNLIEVSESEAFNFACNALALGRKVIIERGSKEVCRRLRELRFEPCEVETGEFMKSGGSVFCLKSQHYR